MVDQRLPQLRRSVVWRLDLQAVAVYPQPHASVPAGIHHLG